MRKSAKRYAAFPKSPMPKRPGSDVGCNRTPLDLGKLTVTSTVMTGAIIQKQGSGVRGRGPDKEGKAKAKIKRNRKINVIDPFRVPHSSRPPAPDTRPPSYVMFIIRW